MAGLERALTAYRPDLEATDAARDAARFLLLQPPLPLLARPGYSLITTGGVAVLPGWARSSLGLPMARPLAPVATGIGRFGTRAVRWAMAGVAQERQLAADLT